MRVVADGRRLGAVCGLLAAVLTVAGCGGTGGARDPGSPAPTTAPASAVTDPTEPTEPAEPTESPLEPAPCDSRTDDVGLHEVYVEGRRQLTRLCAVPGFASDDAESRPGSRYYVAGAAGRVIVASSISTDTVRLFRAARRQGITLTATSSFRTHRHQRDICRADAACQGGDFTFVAPPGWSHHQSGTAIDLRGTFVRGAQSCAAGRRAVDPDSRVWSFLERNARRFGFRQYAAESWHWDASGAEHRC